MCTYLYVLDNKSIDKVHRKVGGANIGDIHVCIAKEERDRDRDGGGGI